MGKRARKEAKNRHKAKVKKPAAAAGTAAAGSSGSASTDASNRREDVAAAANDWERCGHYKSDSLHLRTVLSKIMSYNDDATAACQDCKRSDRLRVRGSGEDATAQAKEGESNIWVCLNCRKYLCTGKVPKAKLSGHAKQHAKEEHHWWAAQYDDPLVGYCFACAKKFPIEMPMVERAGAVALGGNVVAAEGGDATALDNVIRGLPNTGNTCYFNAVLQCLLALNYLRTRILGQNALTGSLGMQLKKLVMETSGANDTADSLDPEGLFSSICLEDANFRRQNMEDSHDLLYVLLNGLHREETDARGQDQPPDTQEGAPDVELPTFVESIFGGETSSTLRSTECEHTSVSHESVRDLSLSLPSKRHPAKSGPSDSTEKVNFCLSDYGNNFDLGDVINDGPEVTSSNKEKTCAGGDFFVMDGSGYCADEEEDVGRHNPVSIERCLALFTKEEVLEERWHCEKCSGVGHMEDRITEGISSGMSCGDKDSASCSTASNKEAECPEGVQEAPASNLSAGKQTSLSNACNDENASPPNQDRRKQVKLDDDANQVEEDQGKQKEDKKVYVNATKQIRISKAPPVLTIQLKRFETLNDVMKKSKERVSFGEKLDMQPYMDPSSENDGTCYYNLIGVIEHIGDSMDGGHYVAYVRASKKGGQQRKNTKEGRLWFRASDEQVEEVDLEDVVNCQAYMFFYEKMTDMTK